MPTLRHAILYGCLAITVGAVLLDKNREATDIVEPVSRNIRPSPIQPSSNSAPMPPGNHDNKNLAHKNLFPIRNSGNILGANQGMLAPPVMPSMPMPPPSNLPFEYLGRQISPAGTFIYLNYQDQTLSIKQGGIAASEYRLQQINTDNLVWVFLPTKEKIIMNIGGEQP